MRFAALTAAAILAHLVCTTGVACAQEIVVADGSRQEAVVGSATLAAAAFETAGYRAQARVLSDLKEVLGTFAALLYVSCAMSAIFTIGMHGSYDTAKWFLIGPALFFFLTKSTTKGWGAEWQYGGEVRQETGNQPSASVMNSEVSWFFHRYNRLVSTSIQGLIAVMSDKQKKEDLRFMLRQRMTDLIFSAELTSADLSALTTMTLVGCSREMEAARILALGRRDPEFQQTAEYVQAKQFFDRWKTPNQTLPEGQVRRYVYGLVQDAPPFPAAASSVDINHLDDCVYAAGAHGGARPAKDSLLAAVNRGGPVSCEQLWCYMGIGLRREAGEIITRINAAASDPSKAAKLTVGQREQLMKALWEDIVVKLTTPPEQRDQNGQVIAKVPPDLSLIPVILSGYLLRKQMLQDPRSQNFTQLTSNSGVQLAPFNYDTSRKMSSAERQQTLNSYLNQQLAEAQHFELYTFAMTLPYVQGILLYVLATTFPFFALMVILPGQAGAFTTWLAVWLWVKSWDFGFSLVMIADEVLWSLMPHNATYNPIIDPNNGPITAFQAAFSGDPAYNLSSYYMILGLLLTGVPVVTAQFVMGAKKAVAGLMISGLSGLGQKYGGAVADYVAVEQLMKLDHARENWLIAEVKRRGFENPADNQMKAGFEQAEAMKSEGSSWKFWSQLTGGLMVVGGIVCCFTGAGAAIGVGLILGGTQVSYAGWSGGLDMQRSGNLTKAELIKQNVRFHYYAAGQADQFDNWDTLRAGISRRVEFGNIPEVPLSALAQVDGIIEQSKKDMMFHRAGAATRGMLAATNAASKGKF